MIPTFPEFGAVSLEMRDQFDAILKNCEPHSDFNFLGLWSWDVRQVSRASRCEDTLVVESADYLTGARRLSCLGSEQDHETVSAIMGFCEAAGHPIVLRLVPHELALALDPSQFSVTEDRDNFDYIYELPSLLRPSGKQLAQYRRGLARFRKEYPLVRSASLDLTSPGDADAVLDVFDLWAAEAKDQEAVALERVALRRLIDVARDFDLVVTGLVNGDGDKLLAFSITERVTADVGVGHFWKALRSHRGAYDFLQFHEARCAIEIGLTRINAEQDLGVETLRQAKCRYGPVTFRRKYTVTSRA